MKRSYLPALVLTQSQDDAEVLNRLLRNAGHAVRPKWISRFEDLEKELAAEEPDLIVSYTKGAGAGLSKVIELRDRHAPLVPVIAISDEVSEEAVAKAIQNGARDLVSLDKTERLVAVVARELDVLGQARSLQAAREKLREYEERFEGIVSESADALAYIQEGIHVSANPAYIELFGFEDADDVEGMPVMDFFDKASQDPIRTAIKNALKGKAIDGEVTLTGRKADGETFDVKAEMRALEYDGEPAVQLAIRSEGGGDSAEYERQLAELERRDSLTGLFNRQYFNQILTQRFQTRQDDNRARCLMLLEPDKFDSIREKIGAVASDDVLKGLGAMLRDHVEDGDIPGRLENTTLTVLLERPTREAVTQWADALNKKIAAHVFEAGGQSTAMTATIGIAAMDEHVETADDVLRNAQEAMAQGKKAGPGSAVFYEPPETDAEGRLSDHAWSKRIRAGVEQDLFQLVHQPIADLTGGDSDLVDILVQLKDEEGEEHPANEFMPAAERAKLVGIVDHWVIDNAVNVLKEKVDKGQSDRYFIRISHQTLADPKLVKWVLTKVKNSGVPAKHVVFEVSENSVDKRLKEAKAFATEARKMGCGFAVEHFGVGLNSMQTLQHLDMDFLKIDGSFMQGIDGDDAKREQVEQFIEAAKARNIATVAERVEDANTMAVLFQLGVAYIQGNYVQEPEVVMADQG
ncbi:EAL domain-containing response regulator [Natronospira bacteriovora]|uniref:EAL domain-containing protein n=1 Tax=Natronospira bacteriovora TaxID=3069753 RepID=A0ABU0W3P3_9GAMM|nr:EAL domain-containing protein [Natronospira sp. AB-CW4]MDQ2068528.1 EAL domain-containing protein [Natronospira sp. AB-CW4]